MTTLTATDIELTIDQEFKDLIPPSSPEQLDELKAAVLAAGRFLDPIRYWEHDGKCSIVDGHQRFGIWCDLPEDTTIPPPRVERMEFPDKEAALNWIESYQISRRNLTPQQLSIVRGRMYQRRKGGKGGARDNSGPKNAQNTGNNSNPQTEGLNSKGSKAAKEVAKMTGVSKATVERDAEYVRHLDAIGKVSKQFKDDIVSGKVKLSRKDVAELAALVDEEIEQAIENVRSGRSWKDTPKREEPKVSAVLDDLGRGVPTYLTAQHAAGGKLVSIGTQLDKFKKAALDAAKEPGGEFISGTDIELGVKTLKDTVIQSIYHTACPRCGNGPKDDCKLCKGHGYIPRSKKGQLSTSDREILGCDS